MYVKKTKRDACARAHVFAEMWRPFGEGCLTSTHHPPPTRLPIVTRMALTPKKAIGYLIPMLGLTAVSLYVVGEAKIGNKQSYNLVGISPFVLMVDVSGLTNTFFCSLFVPINAPNVRA